MQHYTFCLCDGMYCPSKEYILNYCENNGNNYYINDSDNLIPINFSVYNYDNCGNYFTFNCILVDFENILKFNGFIARKKLSDILNVHMDKCKRSAFVIDYLDHITKNNTIKHIKYYLGNNYYNITCWNYYLQSKIFRYSDLSSIRSCLKYLPVDRISGYLVDCLIRNDNVILDYLVDKIIIYLRLSFTHKKYKGNMFKITDNNDKLSDILNVNCVMESIIHECANNNTIEYYHQTFERFQQLLESQENVKVKKDLITKHNKLKLGFTLNDKTLNYLLGYILMERNGNPSIIVKQLLMDGANIYTEIDRDFGFTFFDQTITIIISNENLELLDILFEMKLISQDKLNYILEKSIGELNLKKDVKTINSKEFIGELSGYGADVDKYVDKLIKKANKYNNNKLVDYLKDLKD
ncbi:hypothetical protein [Acanthamoeba polyphaga mimivirus]|uniref:Ankyrin repeat protein n=1 Tax=Acanthamoeba polyphaga mimivirus TaxID=212035 RepID=A0A0G2Y2P9_MIMIV|nr:hypothetical protein [Acanthamoeba polyphaga mimivirus]